MTLAGRLRRLARFDALVLTALLWFMAKFVRYAFPPLFEPLQASYGVSNADLGVAFTGFMLAYAAMQFPSGVLADRLGSVTVITGGATVAGLAALALIVDSPFVVLVAVMVLVGAGTGAHKTVAVRLLSRTYPTQTGRALGVLDTVGTFGGVAAPAAVVVAMGLPGVFGAPWRTLFLVAGIVSIGLAVAFAVRVPARHPEMAVGDTSEHDRADDSFDLRQYGALFRRRRFGTFVLVTVLFSFTYYGAVAFVPLYLGREAGFGTATVGLLYSVLFAVSVVQLLTGEAADRVGMLPVVGATLAVATLGLVALVLFVGSGGLAVAGAAIVCLGVGAHGYRPVRGAYLASIVPDSMIGGGLGVVRTLLMGAGAVAPAFVGYLSEIVGLRAAFSLLAASMAAATVLVVPLLLGERRERRSERDPDDRA